MPNENLVNPLDASPVSRPDLVVFVVIDVSGSMSGERINAVNNAMREVVPILRGVGGSDAIVKLAVLTFSDEAKWRYNIPMDVSLFDWTDLHTETVTNYGNAYRELCDKMSRGAFMKSDIGYKKPIVILMSDGGPTDPEDYPKELERLKSNMWFKKSTKIALAVLDADKDVLEEFAPEAVFEVTDVQQIKKMIKAIAITSAEIGSKSMPIDINTATGDIDAEADKKVIEGIKDAIDDDIWAASVQEDGDFQ